MRLASIIFSLFLMLHINMAKGSGNHGVIDSLLQVVNQSTDPLSLVKSYTLLCWTTRSCDPDQAIVYGTKALQIIEDEPLLESFKPKVLNYIGVVYRNKGDYIIATKYYQDALASSSKQENNLQIAYSNNNLGGISTLKGDYFNAVKYLEKAQYHFKLNKDTAGMGYVAINLGNLYRHNSYLDDAIDYFDQAISYKKVVNDTLGIVMALNLKAISYFQLEDYDKALEIFQQLESSYIYNNDEYGLAVLNNYLGLIELSNKNYKLANIYFQESIKFFDKISNRQGKGNTLINMSMAYHGLGEVKTALKKLSSGYAIAKEIGDKKAIVLAFKNYSIVYSEMGEYKKAYEFEVKHRRALQETFDFQFREKMAALRINSEFENEFQKNEGLKKQNDQLNTQVNKYQKNNKLYLVLIVVFFVLFLMISIRFIVLQRRSKNSKDHNAELLSSNQQLSDANHNRERLLSIIGHDLKNPFNSVLGLTSLLVDEWESIADNEKRYIINEIHGTGNTLFELLDNLLLWAKNQSNTIQQRKEIYDVNEYIVNVYELYRNQASFKEIEIKLDIGKENTVFADPNMISTVLRNLMSNAIKFTRKGGTIQMGVTRRSEELEVYISDNGKGILPEDLQRILDDKDTYSTKGTENETGTGLGLLLVRDFVKQNNGVFWVKSKIGVGSRFYFTLPYKNHSH